MKEIDTEEMAYMIKIFLGLGIEMENEDLALENRIYNLSREPINKIKFIGDPYKVQLLVYRWLNSFERLSNIIIQNKKSKEIL